MAHVFCFWGGVEVLPSQLSHCSRVVPITGFPLDLRLSSCPWPLNSSPT